MKFWNSRHWQAPLLSILLLQPLAAPAADQDNENKWARERLLTGDAKWEARFPGPQGQEYRQLMETKEGKTRITTYLGDKEVYAREEEGRFENVNGMSVYTAKNVKILSGSEQGRSYFTSGGAISVPAKPIDQDTIVMAVGFNFFDDSPPAVVTFKRIKQ